MPAAWGDPQHEYSLASLWKDGGTGVISLLPLLGQDAAVPYSDSVHLPIRKAARIVGIAADTAMLAAAVLEERGLATRTLRTCRGGSFSTWKVSADFAPLDVHRRFSTRSFRFSSELLYGGNWAAMSGATCLVYLALGTMAFRYDATGAEEVLTKRVPSNTWSADFARCLNDTGALRLACASYADIAKATGLHLTSVKAAVRELKHAPSWPDPRVSARCSSTRPALAVYPAVEGQPLVYHFRDHLDPMPFVDGKSAPATRFSLSGVST